MLITFPRGYVIGHWFRKGCFHCESIGRKFSFALSFAYLKLAFEGLTTSMIVS